MAIATPVPLARCVRGEFGAPAADTAAPLWEALLPHPLLLTEDGGSPKQGTQVKFAWDAKALRVLFVAEDSHPWATLREHDAPLYKEEVFEVHHTHLNKQTVQSACAHVVKARYLRTKLLRDG